MADRLKIEIVGRLAPILLRLAREQGRDPNEITEEALKLYLRGLGIDTGPDLGEPVMDMYAGPPGEELHPRDPLPLLLGRMSSRFDLDEAMRVAVEEQHAFREERRERQRRRTGT